MPARKEAFELQPQYFLTVAPYTLICLQDVYWKNIPFFGFSFVNDAVLLHGVEISNLDS